MPKGFHLIADGHGDNRPNRAEIDCTALVRSTTAAPKNYTISFEARWVSGANRLICQTWDHSIGRAFELPIPNNLGTPGAAKFAARSQPRPPKSMPAATARSSPRRPTPWSSPPASPRPPASSPSNSCTGPTVNTTYNGAVDHQTDG